ncbi:MAG: multiheme c-type cytochrome [Candidatus Latescibacterota bacterium]
MGSSLRRVVVAVGSVWLLAGDGARAQYREDTMEPYELEIRDIDSLRTPRTEYVGNDVCRQCHEAAYQKWLGTAHARAFVPMQSQMAATMGQEQRITASAPYQSGKCLTCHATGHDVPADWRGPGFRMGEGVTCEKCHGPGGDHVRYREGGLGAGTQGAAVDSAAGAMIRPAAQWCLECHKPKESHAKVKRPHLGHEQAWARILHPWSAEKPEDELEPEELGIWYLEEAPGAGGARAAYVGSQTCGACHEAAYAKWRQTGHARSYLGLRQETAYAMDLMRDVATVGGPARNGRCLSCHATGHAAPAARREPGFRLREGVGCEGCHGPGSEHVGAMQGHLSVAGLGLTQRPTDESCQQCHRPQRSHERLGRPPFSFPRAWEAVAH